MMCTDKSKFESDIRNVPIDEKIRMDIERIVEEMNYDDQLPERYYDRDEEWDRIKRTCIKSEIKEASKKALELGANQEKIEIAKNMLKDINDYQLISKYTGLSVEEIKKLKL